MEDDLQSDRSIHAQLREIEQPHQIALVLLAHIVQRPKTWLLAHPEAHLSKAQADQLEGLLQRLEAGEPLPYLVGTQEFFGLEFEVNPSVLIPRPETEIMVETALAWLQEHPSSRNGIDVGTGSGCIAISLVSNCPDLNMLATDLSENALNVATKNAQKHNVVDRISFSLSDLIPEDPQPVDLVCANLPYIPTEKLVEVNSLPWEPSLALDGGESGLDLISKLLEKLPAFLNNPALILLETEATLGAQTLQLAKHNFPNAEVSLHKDLFERDRMVRIELK
ncbi:MAG TPA: peptide chain release factor N(5)-glutamine methyltransferase [Anaerolineaceae bacterium]|jgi:release factor glutamine methyltransferase|nr:peptide chain release factor N(5)-glutamine methyltransferase [Anaerolineaceae bacterium]